MQQRRRLRFDSCGQDNIGDGGGSSVFYRVRRNIIPEADEATVPGRHQTPRRRLPGRCRICFYIRQVWLMLIPASIRKIDYTVGMGTLKHLRESN